jgi:putative sensor protein
MKKQSPSNPYLRVIRNPQAYKNIAYLLLAFPTGLMYFLLLVIGSSLGLGLSVIGVGLLILWGTFILAQLGARLERALANNLLGANIPSSEANILSLGALGEGYNWRAILFLFLKFPLGILSFILTTSIISIIFGMISAPFLFSIDTITFGLREIDTLWEALIVSVFGIALLPLTLIFLGRMAKSWRNLAKSMLRGKAYHAKQKRAATESDRLYLLLDDDADDTEIAYYEESTKGVLTG